MLPRIAILAAALLMTGNLSAETRVTAERGDGSWRFPTIPRPSRSNVARNSTITIIGNEPEMSCLSPEGLHNGVLPWQGKQKLHH